MCFFNILICHFVGLPDPEVVYQTRRLWTMHTIDGHATFWPLSAHWRILNTFPYHPSVPDYIKLTLIKRKVSPSALASRRCLDSHTNCHSSKISIGLILEHIYQMQFQSQCVEYPCLTLLDPFAVRTWVFIIKPLIPMHDGRQSHF